MNIIHPLKASLQTQTSFISFHTHVVTEQTLQRAIESGTSLEIDIAVTPAGECYIGHPLEFYAFKGLPPPQNLPLDYVLDRVYDSGITLIIDCKDVRALPKIKTIIERFGAERCVFYSWVDALLFTPYPAGTVIEPHWKHENVPYEKVRALRQQTGVAVVMGARGLTQERLQIDGDKIIKQIIKVAKGNTESIYFYLPNFELPPKWCIDALLGHDLLVYCNVDAVPEDALPKLYHGMTDFAERATVTIN